MSVGADSTSVDPASAELETGRLSKSIQVETLRSDQPVSMKAINAGYSDHLNESENVKSGLKNKSTATFVAVAIAAALLFGLGFTLFSFNFNVFQVRFNLLIFVS
jgi:hypothetical protein